MKAKAKPKSKKKRLVQGRDYHVWALKYHEDGSFDPDTCVVKTSWMKNETTGKWVRVKFVEVKP